MTRRCQKKGSPASPPRGRSQARTPDSSPRRRGAAPSPKTRALAFLATPPPVSTAPRPALALAYEDAAAAARAAELALDEAYESESSEDPRLLPAIATEIEAYDDPKQISPGYSTSEGEDEACRLGCGDLSPYSTSEDEDHAAPLRGRGPLPSYRPSKLTRRSVWKSIVAAHLLPRPNHDLHAIDATPARRRGGVDSSPLDGASTAASSSRNDLVKNYRVHETHG